MKSRAPFPPGVITLCVVFISLCMSLLALLTYQGARSELALANASADNLQSVMTAYQWRFDAYEDVQTALRSGQPEGWQVENGIMSRTVPLYNSDGTEDENRVLLVEIELEPTPRLVTERIVYVGDWQPDESLDLWDGQ